MLSAPSRLVRSRVLQRGGAVAVAGLALVAAGCSSDSTTSGSATSATTGTTVTSATTQPTSAAVQSTVDSAVGAAKQTASSLAQAAGGTDAQKAQADLASTLRANGLNAVATLVERVDLSQVVGDGEFTLFAPNDQAFAALGASGAANLAANPTQAADVLKTHVVRQKLDSTTLAGRTSVQTASGATLPVAKSGGTLTVGGATVVKADITAGKGVVHVIDRVLTP